MIIKAIHTSDWHFFHRHVPTAETITSIRKYILPRIKDVDLFLLPGDVFERVVSLNDDDVQSVIELFVDIFIECYTHNVIFRIVRGTFSHDNHQNRLFLSLFKKLSIPVDFKLIENISVEKFDKLGISVLYLPDNLPFRTKAEVFHHVRTLFTANNISTVDYVVMHGEFEHAGFIGEKHSNAYSYDDFNKICTGLILSGHIHKPTRFKNVVYAGSFNRLAHNEEEAKGFWIISGNETEFIENKEATRFVTVDYREDTQLDDILNKHKVLCDSLDKTKASFVRILISDTHMKQALFKYHSATYAAIYLTFKRTASAASEAIQRIEDRLKLKVGDELVTPSLKNITQLVCDHLNSKRIDIPRDNIEVIINE